jgi:hypothetical protein
LEIIELVGHLIFLRRACAGLPSFEAADTAGAFTGLPIEYSAAHKSRQVDLAAQHKFELGQFTEPQTVLLTRR